MAKEETLTPERREFDQAILNLCDYFKDRFSLHAFNLSVTFRNQEHPDTGDEKTVFAMIGIDPTYLQIKLFVYPALYIIWQEGDYHTVGEALTHEFCHTFLEPLDRYLKYYTSPAQEEHVQDLNEQATQLITRAIFPTVPTHLYHPAPRKPRNSRKRPAQG